MNIVKTTLLATALLASFLHVNKTEAGVIPWAYSAVFGPPGSMAQLRAERLAYRNMSHPYAVGHGAGYGVGYAPVNYGYSPAGCYGCNSNVGYSYGGYSIGYSPFDSNNSFAYSQGYTGYSYAPVGYANSGCSSCSSCATGGCSGPGCAPAVTPARGMKPQVEPNLSNPSNPTPINSVPPHLTPNPNYLDQPKPQNPTTFKQEGFNNNDAPGFVPPVNIETKKVPVDEKPPVKHEEPVNMKKDEIKKEEPKSVEPAKVENKDPAKTLDDIIKQRQPAPPALPEAGRSAPNLQIPDPSPVANHLPTMLVMQPGPSRVSRTTQFITPVVTRTEALAIPASFPAPVVASK